MFKIIKKIAVLSSLFVLSWSCVVDEYSNQSRYSYTLVSFTQRLVRYSSETSVTLLTELSGSESTMNEDGFTYKKNYSENLTLDVEWVADNSWKVSGTDETMNFSLLVSRETSDTLADDYKWTITSFSLEYDESNGYTAEMETYGDIVYEWYETTTSLSRRWTLSQTGTYYLQTYISDAVADSCTLSYDKGDYTAETHLVRTGSGFPN